MWRQISSLPSRAQRSARARNFADDSKLQLNQCASRAHGFHNSLICARRGKNPIKSGVDPPFLRCIFLATGKNAAEKVNDICIIECRNAFAIEEIQFHRSTFRRVFFKEKQPALPTPKGWRWQRKYFQYPCHNMRRRLCCYYYRR